MGVMPVEFYPRLPDRPRVKVSKVPGGWYLYTQYAELEQEPNYGPDEDGWCGYHFSEYDYDRLSVLAQGVAAYKRFFYPSS